MARPWHWLSTLRPGHYWPGHKTRFRLLARLYRVGLAAHKAPTKGFRGNRYISSSLPKLFLAQAGSPGRLPALAPTDPDLPPLGIRLVRSRIRDARGVPDRSCYPLEFREHGARCRSTGRVALQRSRNPAPPSLGRVPSGRVPRRHRYYEVLRVPGLRLASLLLHSLRDTTTCACALLSPVQHA